MKLDMKDNGGGSLPFVVFQIKSAGYAVASRHVREIIRMPQVTAVPQAPPEVRGVINLRGRIIRLIDLRIRLGLTPLRAELDGLIELLHERERDHRQWLAELENSVRERRPFSLARNPHDCKFGRWYDQYRTDDRLLRMTLPSMDAPHRAIHATADAALQRAEAGDTAGALELIASRRNRELAALIRLFEESRRILTEGHRELAIVLSHGNMSLACSADRVEAVEHIPEENIEPMPPSLQDRSGGLCFRVARRVKTDQTLLLLDDDRLLGGSTRDLSANS